MNIITFLRQFRLGPFAIFDIVVSYLGLFLLAPLLSKLFAKFHLSIPRSSWLWWMLPISIVFHWVFRQETALMKALFSRELSLIVFVSLALMIFMGARGCRRLR